MCECVPFNRPVDPEALGLRDYRTVCPQPMDLGTVAARLQAKRYATPDAVVADVRLVFRNASRYNPPGHPVHEAARTLLAHFERKLGALLERLVSTGAAESPDAWLAGYPLDRAAADAEDRAPSVRARLCGNQPVSRCTRQFFTKSFLGDDMAALAPSSGEEPASPRHRADVASMAWRSTRRFRTNAP